MKSTQKGKGGQNIPQLCGQTVHTFCGQRRGGGKKVPKLCGYHIWKPLSILLCVRKLLNTSCCVESPSSLCRSRSRHRRRCEREDGKRRGGRKGGGRALTKALFYQPNRLPNGGSSRILHQFVLGWRECYTYYHHIIMSTGWSMWPWNRLCVELRVAF